MAGGTINCYSPLENSSPISSKWPTLSIRPSNITLGHLSQRKLTFTQKPIHQCPRQFYLQHLKVRNNQCPTRGREINLVHLYYAIRLGNKYEWTNCWSTQVGWNSRALCWVAEKGNLKRLPPVWFHLCDTFDTTILQRWKTDQSLPGEDYRGSRRKIQISVVCILMAPVVASTDTRVTMTQSYTHIIPMPTSWL